MFLKLYATLTHIRRWGMRAISISADTYANAGQEYRVTTVFYPKSCTYLSNEESKFLLLFSFINL